KVGAAPHRGNANRPLTKQGKAKALRTLTKSADQANTQTSSPHPKKTKTAPAEQAKNLSLGGIPCLDNQPKAQP
ncbi:hypothetical protein PQR72_41555, partial [Paraburkholderia madseniana]|uniref:hypothetical protein n=1 Tax=Paraburkholderia madseniana TaxID=2599607 RepID=UPI0038BAD0C7